MKNVSPFAIYSPAITRVIYILPQQGGSPPPGWGQSSYFDLPWDAQPSQPAGYLRLANYSAKRPQIAGRFFPLALISGFSTPNLININFLGSIMAEKYIFCPACNTLTIHNRMSGEISGWICQECNPPLEDFS